MRFILGLLIMSLPLQAAIPSDADILKIRDAINQERKQINAGEEMKRGILGSLYDINKNLGKLDSDIESLEKQLKASKNKIEAQSATIALLENTRDQEKVQLAQRLRALYKMGFHGYAQMLLSSHSSQELARNMKFMKIITEKDAQLLKSYKDNIIKLAGEQLKLRAQIRNYLGFQKGLEESKSKFDEEKEKQVTILSKIEKDKKTHLEALKEWREAAARMEDKWHTIETNNSVLKDINAVAFFENQGHLKPPVPRKIAQKFGLIVNPKFDTKVFHKGLFFAAHIGDTVSALYDGKVVFAGWVNGFGQTLILDHGDHYYSLYAHNSEILKKVGDEVKEGESISLAGDSGSLRGPGLYFEIRHFSESLDPLPWLDLKTVAGL